MDSKTYNRLLDLQKQLQKPEVAQWYQRELLFTPADFKTMKDNVDQAVDILISRKDKSLFLDANVQADVETVQRLLRAAAQKLQASELDPKGVDGKIARLSTKSNTVAAIEAFQRRSNISIDGLVEPGSQTRQALLQAAGET